MKNNMLHMAVGAAMGLTLSSAVNADINPFEMTKLDSGYTVAMSDTPDEGKCGGDKSKKDGKCGEGKCGGDKGKKEAKCGGDKTKMEGKCGGN
ncbi:MAG: hypothetical protein OEY11_06130 [Gammaproteobacteria bacterium]|nr:hypothetical protein [Gammaproteobacteria bacterium]